MQDTPADTGAEPNPDTGPMYVSKDIWVRQDPIPGYQPYSFVADPAWLAAVSSGAPSRPVTQNAEYRDPKYSHPNYVYVRVRNRGGSASTGAERLRVYWAKASTGLAWPTQWVDYVANTCGPNKLYGIEITKPRKNAANASPAERTAYINAVLGADTILWTADMVSYFDKQDQIHSMTAQHGVPAFLPWHREMMNRYEVLLRESDPTVTLLYWDFTTDPTSGVNLMTASFLGTANGVVGAPLTPLYGGGMCNNSRDGFVFPGGPSCAVHVGDYRYPAPDLYRNKAFGAPGILSDATTLTPTTFPSFRGMEGNPHGTAHVYINGNMGSIPTAAEDPMFFMLHANVDRLWAMWQRANNPAYLGRRDPATVYGTDGASFSITTTMIPWNGGSAIPPWTGAPGNYTYAKTSKDPSVVDAPVYDTAPLTVPLLQPGESCVIEIPWYPPNPADYSCFGGDQGHVCLLARLETDTNAPFGMTFAEGSDMDVNTRNNNNIIWRNITVQDFWPGPLIVAPVWLRNLSPTATVPTRIQLHIPVNEQSNGLFNFGALQLNLGPALYQRWQQNGAIGQGIQITGGNSNTVQVVSPDAYLDNIPLSPGEAEQIETQFLLSHNYPNPQGRAFHVNLEQIGAPGVSNQFIGGQQVKFDFNKLPLITVGTPWRYQDTGQFPGTDWTSPNYDDSQWPVGQAKLGYGEGDETTLIRSGTAAQQNITCWFRRTFVLTDPSLYNSLWLRLRVADGAVVYLNGTELYRYNLPSGAGITPNTLALSPVNGLAQKVFYPVNLSSAIPLLQLGSNVVAVEVHQVSASSGQAEMDMELLANPSSATFGSVVTLLTPADASLQLQGVDLPIMAQGIDPDGSFLSMSFYADGLFLGNRTQTPYSVTWTNPPPGTHQITVTATDASGLSQSAFATVMMVSNLPPIITITNPPSDSMYNAGDPIAVNAAASDPDGAVQFVQIYLREHNSFASSNQLAGTATAPPYAFQLSAPTTVGHYVLTAVATDNLGLSTPSDPVHFMVMAVQPTLTISFSQSQIVLDWTPATATLQQAPTVAGPWTVVSNAVPPLHIITPNGSQMFYRVRVP